MHHVACYIEDGLSQRRGGSRIITIYSEIPAPTRESRTGPKVERRRALQLPIPEKRVLTQITIIILCCSSETHLYQQGTGTEFDFTIYMMIFAIYIG